MREWENVCGEGNGLRKRGTMDEKKWEGRRSDLRGVTYKDYKRHVNQNNDTFGNISKNIDNNQNDRNSINKRSSSTRGRFYTDMRLC